jgi:hypothetical protein
MILFQLNGNALGVMFVSISRSRKNRGKTMRVDVMTIHKRE